LGERRQRKNGKDERNRKTSILGVRDEEEEKNYTITHDVVKIKI